MNTPRISVILPAYNAEDTLSEAIRSILHQTEREIELVVINDGSTDASPDIIEQWRSRDKRIVALDQPHRGIVAALNHGLQHACGQYIARMDTDDRSLPERLCRQADFLDAHPSIGLAACLVSYKGTNSKHRGYARYVTWTNTLTTHQQIQQNRFIESPLAHPSVCFRRKLIEKHGVYRCGPFPEDYELWLRWLSRGVTMAKVPEYLLEWRDRPDRLSRTHQRYSMDAFYRIKAQYLAPWLEEHNPHHPELMIWGAGKTSRKRAEYLVRRGIHITHYIDVDPNKIGNVIQGRPVIGHTDLPSPESAFIVSYVGLRGVNQQIRNHLQQHGYRWGSSFIFAA
ncbi:glycosyltransferase [Fodinibius sediminis]|uniref:Glycosyltransferase involved in cell wall bisynthesis n=1 Tax=Fodinibius sediminis TaxID=1214077 RepID=A0A521AS10_9BACT|nr:glycosyltransferase [Fodinibius sediminis]SMO37602.1 Glycosyltransferase involved in cell wall bisynthesis [Fodinibius sediminis]